MTQAVVVSMLLVVTASLGSWFLSQWLAARRTQSTLAMINATAGIVLLIGAVALLIILLPTWIPHLSGGATTSPAVDARSSIPFPPASLANAPTHDPRAANASGSVPQARIHPDVVAHLDSAEAALQRYDSNLALHHWRLAQSSPEHTAIEASRISRMHASIQTQAKSEVLNVATVEREITEQWPATGCVKSHRSIISDSPRISLLADCERDVAVVIATCPFTEMRCGASGSSGWRYVSKGIVLTSSLEKPLQPGGEQLPVIASSFTQALADQRQPVRYLACYLSSQQLLAFIASLHAGAAQPDEARDFDAAASDDPCYQQVLNLTRAGTRTGKSPDALLRDATH